MRPRARKSFSNETPEDARQATTDARADVSGELIPVPAPALVPDPGI